MRRWTVPKVISHVTRPSFRLAAKKGEKKKKDIKDIKDIEDIKDITPNITMHRMEL